MFEIHVENGLRICMKECNTFIIRSMWICALNEYSTIFIVDYGYKWFNWIESDGLYKNFLKKRNKIETKRPSSAVNVNNLLTYASALNPRIFCVCSGKCGTRSANALFLMPAQIVDLLHCMYAVPWCYCRFGVRTVFFFFQLSPLTV